MYYAEGYYCHSIWMSDMATTRRSDAAAPRPPHVISWCFIVYVSWLGYWHFTSDRINLVRFQITARYLVNIHINSHKPQFIEYLHNTWNVCTKFVMANSYKTDKKCGMNIYIMLTVQMLVTERQDQLTFTDRIGKRGTSDREVNRWTLVRTATTKVPILQLSRSLHTHVVWCTTVNQGILSTATHFNITIRDL